MSLSKKTAAAIAAVSAFLVPALALAQEKAAEAGSNANDVKMAAAIGAGIAIGLGPH